MKCYNPKFDLKFYVYSYELDCLGKTGIDIFETDKGKVEFDSWNVRFRINQGNWIRHIGSTWRVGGNDLRIGKYDRWYKWI